MSLLSPLDQSHSTTDSGHPRSDLEFRWSFVDWCRRRECRTRRPPILISLTCTLRPRRDDHGHTTSRPSHAPNVVLIVGTAPMIPRIRSQVRLLPETPTQPDTSRNRPAGAPLRPPVIDGIEELDPTGRIEELDQDSKLDNALHIEERNFLASMRFHPIGGGPEDDKDGQKAWFTARIASLIG